MLWNKEQSCGTCFRSYPEKVGDTGIVQLICAGLPPQISVIRRTVDGKEVEVLDSKLPAVPASWGKQCALYKRTNTLKVL